MVHDFTMNSHSEKHLIVTLILMWISLIMICQHVHAMAITINTTSGRNSTECCIDGKNCSCSSLSTALLYMTSNTVINITSESVTLEDNIKMGSGDLNNITITGNGATTIMCNNSGGVYCESCDNVVIEGITWDRCGDPNGTNIAGVTFNITSNISLLNCTFQHSQIQAVSILKMSGYVVINKTEFLYNSQTTASNDTCGGLSIGIDNKHLTVTVCESYFLSNGHFCNMHSLFGSAGGLVLVSENNVASLDITVVRTLFVSNNGAAFFQVFSDGSLLIKLIEIFVCDNVAVGASYVAGIGYLGSADTSSRMVVSSSVFCRNAGSTLWLSPTGNYLSVLISNSSFTNNTPSTDDDDGVATVGFFPSGTAMFTLVDVQIVNCSTAAYRGGGGTVFMVLSSSVVYLNLTRVSMQSNNYAGDTGGVVYVQFNSGVDTLYLCISECYFSNNSSPGVGAALYIVIATDVTNSTVMISHSVFHQNYADDSIVYAERCTNIQVTSSTFINNIGSSMHLSSSSILCGSVLFENNTASNGAALYLDQGSTITIDIGAVLHFINNSAIEHGGAIYVVLPYDCPEFSISQLDNSSAVFTNNLAGISGSSIYFSIPKLCEVDTDVSSSTSIIYTPCQFNYSQVIHSITTYHNCTYFNGTESPIVTSPHELRLYFPNNGGVNISSNSDHNIYYIKNNILGHEVKFNGATFDYFGKPAEPTQFGIECIDCPGSVKPDLEHVLIDNSSYLNIKFFGQRITENGINVTLYLRSNFLTFKQISTALIVELLPCIGHPGNVYSEKKDMCICYYHNVRCSDTYNEIRRGYWFGSVGGTPTTSLCPNHYCKFVGRNETTQGYFELPKTVNGQCNDHRLGSACGKCGPGYTLAYDSTDCISIDHCSTGMTVLVLVLTCLYWIVVVVGVFSLMYFNFQISSGYVYGIIYYYSVMSILLDNNPYISDGAFQFVSILSSFAQLSPQFLGQLCFVKKLSGIDQLFIHYSHAVAVSILTLVIVLAARCSVRITVLVSRCIIRVICLLLLLSYTSLTSTSLQLLRPLKFTDVNEVYTYASPHIGYFHGHHAIYGIVAVTCELVVGIGLPLLLLLEPLLSRKINFINIKPLLDQFQGCYKDKYRWFAAYYLICRQAIMLIVFVGNSNYYNMLFYLQTTLVVIAMIHMWAQPYQDELLNALDGLILLVMVLVININTFPFLHSVTTEISLTLFILPLLLFCLVIIRKTMHSYIAKKKRRHHYVPIGNDNRVADENAVNQ
ncbi:uncharacterized protein [Dysidea avara]